LHQTHEAWSSGVLRRCRNCRSRVGQPLPFKLLLWHNNPRSELVDCLQ
jgi:hypothetical protein